MSNVKISRTSRLVSSVSICPCLLYFIGLQDVIQIQLIQRIFLDVAFSLATCEEKLSVGDANICSYFFLLTSKLHPCIPCRGQSWFCGSTAGPVLQYDLFNVTIVQRPYHFCCQQLIPVVVGNGINRLSSRQLHFTLP